MTQKIELPADYRPWPSAAGLQRQIGEQWKTLPADYTPYLGENTPEGGKSLDWMRTRWTRTWQASGVDVEELLHPANSDNTVDADSDDGPAPARPIRPARSIGGDEEDSAHFDGEDRGEDEAGDVGPDELAFADTDTLDDGTLIYRNRVMSPTGEYVALNAKGEHITDADGRDIITDSEGRPRDLNRRGDTIGIDHEGKVYYLFVADHKDKKVAATREGHLLQQGGKPIALDENNYPLPPKKTLWNRILNGDQKDEPEEYDVLFDANGIPVTDFEVPRIGQSATPALKSRHRILAGIAGAAVLLAGVTFVGGLIMGTSRVPAEGAVTAQEAEKYRLSSFDVNGASAFGREYLQICLTHTSEQQRKAREEVLQTMQSSTAVTNCGLVEGGSQQPVMVNFNGYVEERPAESHGDGEVAYLGFNVAMTDGTFSSRVVPIWAGTSKGMPSYRVVGNVGEMPALLSDPVQDTDGGFAYDTKVPAELRGPLQTFFTAWGASRKDDLQAATTSEATGMALEGMHGQVKNPKIAEVKAIPSTAPTNGDSRNPEWTYTEGSQVTAITTVEWTKQTASEPITQQTGYRVTLEYTGGKWVVADLQGGSITDGERGADDGAEPGSLGSISQLSGGGENASGDTGQ